MSWQKPKLKNCKDSESLKQTRKGTTGYKGWVSQHKHSNKTTAPETERVLCLLERSHMMKPHVIQLSHHPAKGSQILFDFICSHRKESYCRTQDYDLILQIQTAAHTWSSSARRNLITCGIAYRITPVKSRYRHWSKAEQWQIPLNWINSTSLIFCVVISISLSLHMHIYGLNSLQMWYKQFRQTGSEFRRTTSHMGLWFHVFSIFSTSTTGQCGLEPTKTTLVQYWV